MMETKPAARLHALSDLELSKLIGKAQTMTLDQDIYGFFMQIAAYAVDTPVTLADHEFGMTVGKLAVAHAWTDLAMAFVRKMRPNWHIQSLTPLSGTGWAAYVCAWKDRGPGLRHGEAIESAGPFASGVAFVPGLAIISALFRLIELERRGGV